MEINRAIIKIKEANPNKIVLVESGPFYHVFGTDTYILSYLCGYQVRTTKKEYNTCGFPKKGLNKTLQILEDNEIDYITVVEAENYEVTSKMEFGEENSYARIYERAHKHVLIKKRIDAIYDYLIGNINSPNIKKTVEMLEEDLFEN